MLFHRPWAQQVELPKLLQVARGLSGLGHGFSNNSFKHLTEPHGCVYFMISFASANVEVFLKTSLRPPNAHKKHRKLFSLPCSVHHQACNAMYAKEQPNSNATSHVTRLPLTLVLLWTRTLSSTPTIYSIEIRECCDP